MSAIVEEVRASILEFIDCSIRTLQDGSNILEVTIPRMESCISTLQDISQLYTVEWAPNVISMLEHIVNILAAMEETVQPGRIGRPKYSIPFCTLEYLLSLNFRVSDISKLFGVSVSTIFRRLAENGTSARASYTQIGQDCLNRIVLEILNGHPNTGYKRMKGYLLHRGVKVTDLRVREVMRFIDPIGVYQRTIERNRVIRRRQYFVKYSNQLWHIDGNLKLIRWGIVVRGAIDGKSRTVTYLVATSNNRADTHLDSFLAGVHKFGIPLHTRSDKGGENVLIARFMIENRGVGRSSHICGRSVHNQRIERYWRDVRTGCTWIFRTMFETLEDQGILDIDNEKHLKLLHRIFLPRINKTLQEFVNGWNSHPISTERNLTPAQLMLMNLPPPHLDLTIPRDIHEMDLLLHNYEDLAVFEQDSLTNPNIGQLTSADINLPSGFDLDRASECFGFDVFSEAKQYLVS